MDLDVKLEPRQRRFEVAGTYDLVNMTDEPMHRFPMSVGDHFEDMKWTLVGVDFEPEEPAVLFVFNLVPIPPLDGAAVVAGLFEPARRLRDQLRSSGFGGLLGLLVAWAVIGRLYSPLFWWIVFGWLYPDFTSG